MEPYRRQPKPKAAEQETKGDTEANSERRRHADDRNQDQIRGPGYYSEYRHYQYYHHHYYPPYHPSSGYPYYDRYYPQHYQHYAARAPPPHAHAPSPDARWHPPRTAAVPVTDEVKQQSEDNDDDRKRPANISSRNDSEGSRKLDLYEPIPWDQAKATPILSTSDTQLFTADPHEQEDKDLSTASKSSPPNLKQEHRESSSGSFSPIEMSSSTELLKGSQYEKADSIWDVRFKELAAFKLEHGHCNVPQKYPPNKSLGIWVNKQRMEYNKRLDGKKASLTDSRLDRLKSLDFRWARRKGEASWENHFASLVRFREENGHCSVPTKYKKDTALGRWVSTQRAEYKKFKEGEPSNMTPEKVKRLEKLEFAWWLGV